MKSNWVGVTRAVLQRYWIQPCSASSLMIWMMGTVYLQKFADYTKLVEVADTSAVVLPSRGTSTGRRNKLTGALEVCQREVQSPAPGEKHQYMPGATHLESSSARKDLGILLDTEMTTSHKDDGLEYVSWRKFWFWEGAGEKLLPQGYAGSTFPW